MRVPVEPGHHDQDGNRQAQEPIAQTGNAYRHITSILRERQQWTRDESGKDKQTRKIKKVTNSLDDAGYEPGTGDVVVGVISLARNPVELCLIVTHNGIVIPSAARNLLFLTFKSSRFLAPKAGARNDNLLHRTASQTVSNVTIMCNSQ
jgi:hypothetical protein